MQYFIPLKHDLYKYSDVLDVVGILNFSHLLTRGLIERLTRLLLSEYTGSIHQNLLYIQKFKIKAFKRFKSSVFSIQNFAFLEKPFSSKRVKTGLTPSYFDKRFLRDLQ